MPAKFMTEIVGTDGEFTTDEVTFQIRNIIVQQFSQTVAQSGIPVLDMAANTGEFGGARGAGASPRRSAPTA
jgi:membrane protease subunit (stomatin/prohibitin family)